MKKLQNTNVRKLCMKNAKQAETKQMVCVKSDLITNCELNGCDLRFSYFFSTLYELNTLMCNKEKLLFDENYTRV